MRFAEAGWLALLCLVPLPWMWARARPRLAWPTLEGFRWAPRGFAGWGRALPLLLRTAALGCLVVAMARPQTVGGQTRIAGKGVGIVVALDQSSSMDARDFPAARGVRISRLEAAKRTFARFVAGRPDDLIGLVVFANYPDLACPPTLDHAFLLETAKNVQSARPGDDGTNLGDAIAWSVETLRSASTKKKVLILLTDGHNEPAVSRPLDPEEAAAMARDLGITVHTIAIGREGGLIRRPERVTGLDLIGKVGGPDLELLDSLATLGGGRSFTATDANALDQVFQTIDSLEKSPVQSVIRTRYHEQFAPWVGAALVLLLLDRLLAPGRLRRLP